MSEVTGDRSTRRRHATLLVCGAIFLVVAVLTVALVASQGGRGVAATTEPTELGISMAGSDLLQYDPQADPWPAPSFSLTDQHGHPVRLADFRGKAVVLSFNDDRCEDLCSLLAEDVVAADRDLGAAASDVEFVSINANPYFPRPHDVLAWTTEHGLAGEANWVFATASPDVLAQVASDYGVPVQLQPEDKSVVHGAELFFINPSGHVAALGQFGAESASTALFGHVMAQAAVDLLPDATSVDVGGPPPGDAASSSVAIGSRAPTFALPRLDDPSRTTGLSSGRGRLTVLNFWSSSCAPCRQEMPAIEHVHRALGDDVDVIGIDVADSRQRARELARRAGVTYPLLSDASGTAAGDYRVTGLPFTVIVGTDGTVMVRRPGALTAEELQYTVQSLMPPSTPAPTPAPTS